MRARRRARSRLTQVASVALVASGVLLACSGTKFSVSDDCADAACAGDAPTDGGDRNHGGNSAPGSGDAGSSSGNSGSESGGQGGTDASSSGGAGASGDKSDGGVAGGLGGGGGGAGRGGSSALMDFPQTGVLDDFNRMGPALGAQWSGETAEFSLKEQALWCENCVGAVLWDEPFGERQEVFATFQGFDNDANEINLVLKAKGSSTCDLVEVLYSPAMTSVRIAYCAENQWFDLDETPLLLEPGDRFGARAYADGKVEIFHNATRVTTYDVSDFPFKFGRIGVNGVASDNGLTWDDFGGGDF